jgi:hypothetical protein
MRNFSTSTGAGLGDQVKLSPGMAWTFLKSKAFNLQKPQALFQ